MTHSRLTILSLPFVLLVGCSSTPPIERARTEFYLGNYGKAQRVIQSAKSKQKDKLLQLMEQGMILHTGSRFEESNRVFKTAVKEFEVTPISVGRKLVSTVTTDRAKTFRGEEFERRFVHMYTALNHAVLNEPAKALAACREALKGIDPKADTIEQLMFVRYLMAFCHEWVGENREAYDQLITIQNRMPVYQRIKLDLVRMARKLGLEAEAVEWSKLPGPIDTPDGESQLLLIVQTAIAPYKVAREMFIPPSHRVTMPVFVQRPSPLRDVEVTVDSGTSDIALKMLDVDALADHTISRKKIRLGVGEFIRKGAQEVLAQSTETGAGEALVRTAFFALGGGDQRNWQTLPRDVRILRLHLKPGAYTFHIRGLDYSGLLVGEAHEVAVRVPAKGFALKTLRLLQ